LLEDCDREHLYVLFLFENYYYFLKKEMIRPTKKSKKQKSKNEDPDKLDREKEQRKSIQRQLQKENKQIVYQIGKDFQENSCVSIKNKQTISNTNRHKSQSISSINSSQKLMNKLSKQEQEQVQMLYERALNQRQERLKRR
jgi:hypothetical protein